MFSYLFLFFSSDKLETNSSAFCSTAAKMDSWGESSPTSPSDINEWKLSVYVELEQYIKALSFWPDHSLINSRGSASLLEAWIALLRKLKNTNQYLRIFLLHFTFCNPFPKFWLSSIEEYRKSTCPRCGCIAKLLEVLQYCTKTDMKIHQLSYREHKWRGEMTLRSTSS